MKPVILIISCLSIVYGAPVDNADVQLLRYENNNDGLGHYNFAFETSDGTKRKEDSEVIHAGDPDNEQIIVRGEFEYIGPDGITYRVTYIADENGFHPQGDHLPKSPESNVPSTPFVLQSFPPGVVASLLG